MLERERQKARERERERGIQREVVVLLERV